MKQPADILLLDEPTNNLDLPSLEVLEESLLEFPGAIVVVTHDRYMIHEVPNLILALDGKGGAGYYADYAQWESSLEEKEEDKIRGIKEKPSRAEFVKERGRGLSTAEKKELLEIGDRIEKAEASVLALQERMGDPATASDHEKLIQLQMELDEAQQAVEKLYRRWENLEKKAEPAK